MPLNNVTLVNGFYFKPNCRHIEASPIKGLPPLSYTKFAAGFRGKYNFERAAEMRLWIFILNQGKIQADLE